MSLTRLETEVIQLRARGLTMKEVAQKMGRSVYGVKRASERTFRKTRTHSVAELLWATGALRRI